MFNNISVCVALNYLLFLKLQPPCINSTFCHCSGLTNAHTVPLKKPFDFNGIQATHIIFSGGGGIGVVFNGTHADQLAKQYKLTSNSGGFGGWRKYQRQVGKGKDVAKGWDMYTMLYADETSDGKYTALYCLMDTKQSK